MEFRRFPDLQLHLMHDVCCGKPKIKCPNCVSEFEKERGLTVHLKLKICNSKFHEKPL